MWAGTTPTTNTGTGTRSISLGNVNLTPVKTATTSATQRALSGYSQPQVTAAKSLVSNWKGSAPIATAQSEYDKMIAKGYSPYKLSTMGIKKSY
jgi:hypothetical protein